MGTKFAQIAGASSPPALTDTLIGVGGGTTDQRYTLTQVASTVGTANTSIIRNQLPSIILPVGDDALVLNPPTQTTNASGSPSLSRFWPASYQQVGTTFGLTNQNVTYTQTNFDGVPGGGFGVLAYFNFAVGPAQMSFYHTGQNLEIGYTGHATAGTGNQINFLVKIQGQYLSLTPTFAPNDSNVYYLKLQWASRATRRIDVLGVGGYLPGVAADVNDTITPAELRGPLTCISGDSMLGGSAGLLPPQTYGQTFADAMGWDNVYIDGIGGSGWTAGTTLASRFASNVLPINPQLYIICLGFNDANNGVSPATTQAAATSTLATVKASLPNALIIVCGTFGHTGPFGWNGSTNFIGTDNAIKAAAAANGLPFLSFINQPIPTWMTTSGYSLDSPGITAGASTFRVPFNTLPSLPWPCVIDIDGEYAEVESASSNLYTIDGTFANNHSIGATINLHGQSFWTGHGNTGSPTGWGNCDLFVYSDAVHPTVPAQYALGVELAKRVKSYIRNQTDPWGQQV